MTRGQLRLLNSLVHLTDKHGPRRFDDVVRASGKSRQRCARNMAWLIVNGYVQVDRNDPNKILTPVVDPSEVTL